MALIGKFAERLRRSFQLEAGEFPRADLRFRDELRLVELLDQLLESGHSLNGGIDDQRIHLRVCPNHDFARLLEIWPRSASTIPRHRWLGVHLIDRLRQIFCPRDPQWEDPNLPTFGIEPVRIIEIRHDGSNLFE